VDHLPWKSKIRPSIYSKRIQYPRPGFGFEAGFLIQGPSRLERRKAVGLFLSSRMVSPSKTATCTYGETIMRVRFSLPAPISHQGHFADDHPSQKRLGSE
jgi:hypothetical protein